METCHQHSIERSLESKALFTWTLLIRVETTWVISILIELLFSFCSD